MLLASGQKSPSEVAEMIGRPKDVPRRTDGQQIDTVFLLDLIKQKQIGPFLTRYGQDFAAVQNFLTDGFSIIVTEQTHFQAKVVRSTTNPWSLAVMNTAAEKIGYEVETYSGTKKVYQLGAAYDSYALASSPDAVREFDLKIMTAIEGIIAAFAWAAMTCIFTTPSRNNTAVANYGNASNSFDFVTAFSKMCTFNNILAKSEFAVMTLLRHSDNVFGNRKTRRLITNRSMAIRMYSQADINVNFLKTGEGVIAVQNDINAPRRIGNVLVSALPILSPDAHNDTDATANRSLQTTWHIAAYFDRTRSVKPSEFHQHMRTHEYADELTNDYSKYTLAGALRELPQFYNHTDLDASEFNGGDTFQEARMRLGEIDLEIMQLMAQHATKEYINYVSNNPPEGPMSERPFQLSGVLPTGGEQAVGLLTLVREKGIGQMNTVEGGSGLVRENAKFMVVQYAGALPRSYIKDRYFEQIYKQVELLLFPGSASYPKTLEGVFGESTDDNRDLKRRIKYYYPSHVLFDLNNAGIIDGWAGKTFKGEKIDTKPLKDLLLKKYDTPTYNSGKAGEIEEAEFNLAHKHIQALLLNIVFTNDNRTDRQVMLERIDEANNIQSLTLRFAAYIVLLHRINAEELARLLEAGVNSYIGVVDFRVSRRFMESLITASGEGDSDKYGIAFSTGMNFQDVQIDDANDPEHKTGQVRVKGDSGFLIPNHSLLQHLINVKASHPESGCGGSGNGYFPQRRRFLGGRRIRLENYWEEINRGNSIFAAMTSANCLIEGETLFPDVTPVTGLARRQDFLQFMDASFENQCEEVKWHGAPAFMYINPFLYSPSDNTLNPEKMSLIDLMNARRGSTMAGAGSIRRWTPMSNEPEITPSYHMDGYTGPGMRERIQGFTSLGRGVNIIRSGEPSSYGLYIDSAGTVGGKKMKF